MKIKVKWDDRNLYGYGKDSVDLDNNGDYDLFISLSLLNNDSIHLLNGSMPDPFPFCRLQLHNGLEIAVCKEIYPIGLGQTATASYTDTVKYNERIDIITDWFNDSINSIAMWQKNPGFFGLPSYGSWFYVKSICYIAFKTNQQHYGWLEVNATNPENPEFTKFAIKK